MFSLKDKICLVIAVAATAFVWEYGATTLHGAIAGLIALFAIAIFERS